MDEQVVESLIAEKHALEDQIDKHVTEIVRLQIAVGILDTRISELERSVVHRVCNWFAGLWKSRSRPGGDCNHGAQEAPENTNG